MPISPGLTATWGSEQWSPVLLEALSLQSAVLRAGATRIVSEGRVVHVPRLKVNPAASWVAELAQIPSDFGDADTLQLVPKKVGNVVTLSTESIGDSSVDELNAVGRGMVRGVARQIDLMFFSNGVATATTPAGVRSSALPNEIAAISIDSILDGIGAIEAVGGNADTVFLAPQDITSLRKATTSYGEYLLAPEDGGPQGPGATSIGGAALIPTAGLTAGTAIVCQASFIQLAVRRDATVDFSRDAAFLNDGVVARVTMRVDWGIGDPSAFFVIKPS